MRFLCPKRGTFRHTYTYAYTRIRKHSYVAFFALFLLPHRLMFDVNDITTSHKYFAYQCCDNFLPSSALVSTSTTLSYCSLTDFKLMPKKRISSQGNFFLLLGEVHGILAICFIQKLACY